MKSIAKMLNFYGTLPFPICFYYVLRHSCLSNKR